MSEGFPVWRGGERDARRPPGIYASKFNADLAAEICERLASGETLRSICADARMPAEKTVWNWGQAHPAFGARKAACAARGRAIRTQAVSDRRAPKGRYWAGEGCWNRYPDSFSEARADAICEAIVEGASLEEACARPGMPSVGTVYNWLRRYPKFADWYRFARLMQGDWLEAKAEDIALGPGGVRERQRALKDLRRRAGRLMTRGSW